MSDQTGQRMYILSCLVRRKSTVFHCPGYIFALSTEAALADAMAGWLERHPPAEGWKRHKIAVQEVRIDVRVIDYEVRLQGVTEG